MEFQVVAGNITDQQVDAAVVNLFQGITSPGGATGAVDAALGGLISQLISDGEITGKAGESVLIHTPKSAYPNFGPRRVLIAGLGRQEKADIDTVRALSAAAGRRLREVGVKSAATTVHGAGIGGLDVAEAAEALAEGTLLGLYRFDKYKSKNDDSRTGPDTLTVVERDQSKVPAVEQGVERGRVFAEAAMLARDLVNEPANHLSPTMLAERAQQMANGSGLACEILEATDCEKLGMGAFLGVAKGSEQPPKFIHLSYGGDPAHADNNVWLVGKGITFDTGGISIKPAQGMGAMKGDMGGGAAVIGAMQAIAALKPKINVHGVCAATENMPGGRAQRPGDVVQAMNGKWIEVDNTDAEGRLTLADAIGFAQKNGAKRVVDIATLTGAVIIALGQGNIGLFSNDDELAGQVIEAGRRRGEPMWRMPLDSVSKKLNESKIADVKNTGGRSAGSITAAHFIQEFVDEGVPWVHLDIAAVNMTDSARGVLVPGATGQPARSLIELVLNLAK